MHEGVAEVDFYASPDAIKERVDSLGLLTVAAASDDIADELNRLVNAFTTTFYEEGGWADSVRGYQAHFSLHRNQMQEHRRHWDSPEEATMYVIMDAQDRSRGERGVKRRWWARRTGCRAAGGTPRSGKFGFICGHFGLRGRTGAGNTPFHVFL